jgi:hypothetical protein
MEYLMTYGWAILVIAVVLGVLYSLGIFNPSNFAPKAQPGSCQVLRPNGPGTSYDLNLEGECGGELPQYVANFSGRSSISDINNSGMNPTNGTISVWYEGTGSGRQFIWSMGNDGAANDFDLIATGGGSGSVIFYFRVFSDADVQYNTNVKVNPFSPTTFYNVVARWNSSNSLSIYLNGIRISSAANVVYPAFFGCLGKIGGTCNGQGLIADLANVQEYNASLSASEIHDIYSEGIGGAPIRLQNLIAWYPLNGNANDYSGNNNGGMPANVEYAGSWTGSYAPP